MGILISEFHFLRPLWLLIVPLMWWIVFLLRKKWWQKGDWNSPNIPKKYNQLILSIHKRQYTNIAFYLRKYKDYSLIYKTICKYFGDIHKLDLKTFELKSMEFQLISIYVIAMQKLVFFSEKKSRKKRPHALKFFIIS